MAGNLDIYNNSNKQEKKNNLKNIISSLTNAQKISIGLIVVIIFIGLFVLFKWNSQPEYSVLYSDLSASDAASVVEKLDSEKIKYQLSDDGSVIKVEKRELANARLLLAEQGIALNSVVGFELFDKQLFGLTDFTQKVNYQRALEGELSRTISELEGVKTTRVHLVLPDDDIFSDKETTSSASIILSLEEGKQLKEGGVRAITNLVASAVEGLKKENITVADSSGNLLSSGSDNGAVISEQQSVVSEFESGLEKDITLMLAQIYGLDNVIVRANADINFEKKNSEIETFMPEGDGNGVILSQSSVKETYDNKNSLNGANEELGAGTDANVASTDDAAATTTTSVAGNEEANNYSKDENQTQFGVSKKVEKINSEGGKLEKLSIGIFINKTLDATQIADLQAVVSAAAGINTARGDAVSIKGIKFASYDTGLLDETQSTGGTKEILPIISKYFPGILLVLMLMLLTVRSFKKETKSVSIKNLFKRKNLSSRLENKAITDDGVVRPGKEIGKSTDGETKNIEKDLMEIAGRMENELKKSKNAENNKDAKGEKKSNKVEEYIPPEPSYGKINKLRDLVVESVTDSSELARRIVKNWVDDK